MDTKFERRLRWFRHVQKRDSGYIGQTILSVKLPGRRKRGRAQKKINGCSPGG